MIVFAISPGSDQQRRIDYIWQRAKGCFSKHSVTVEETRGYLTAYVTVTVDPDPLFHGDLARYAVFGDQAKCAVYWDWPAPPDVVSI